MSTAYTLLKRKVEVNTKDYDEKKSYKRGWMKSLCYRWLVFKFITLSQYTKIG